MVNVMHGGRGIYMGIERNATNYRVGIRGGYEVGKEMRTMGAGTGNQEPSNCECETAGDFWLAIGRWELYRNH